MDPGFRLRQIRARLGLTYRDVHRASLALARVHTRPQFAVHISRLADIETGGVVPNLHKLYALAVVYHLNPLEILRWYDIPFDRFLGDAVSFHAPQTHLMESPVAWNNGAADKVVHPFGPSSTEFMPRSSAHFGGIENILNNENGRHRYGCIAQ